MKKLAILPIIFSLFISIGCSEKQDFKIQNSSLKLYASIKYGDTLYEGEFRADEKGNCEFAFFNPQTLKGFSVYADSDGMELKYKGLSQKIPVSDISEGAFIYEIYELLKSIPQDAAVDIKNDKIIYEGDSNGRAFTLTLDSNGIPLAIDIKSLGMTAEFKNIE